MAGNKQQRDAVRQFAPVKNQPKKASGVTETIAAGFSEVLARPWLMALPLLLDLYYWLGWRILPTALTERLSRSVSESSFSEKESVVKWLADVGKLDLSGLIGLLVPSGIFGLLSPSRLIRADRDGLYEVWSRPAIVPHSYLTVCLIALLFLLASSLFYMAFVVPLADVVMSRKRPWRQFPKAITVAWLRVLGLQAIVIGLILLVFGPIVVITGIFEVVGVDFSGLVATLMMMTAVAAIIYLWFVTAAIAAAEVGPFRAIYFSVNVVRRDFWQTLGLISASILIGSGLPELWSRLMDTPPGLLIAVVAHAFFAVGLSIASLIFFIDRLRLLRFDVAKRALSIARRTTV